METKIDDMNKIIKIIIYTILTAIYHVNFD